MVTTKIGMQNIFLIGPIGAGKTTIGKQLASELGRDFYDTDQEVEYRAGVDLSWIYDLEGDEGFRNREQKVIDELTQLHNIVLSTGGGSILSPENRNVLAGRGYVVYLQVSVSQQLTRTEKDRKRPALLQAENREEFFESMIRDRETLYESIADVTFFTDQQSPRAVVSMILKHIQQDLS